MSPFARPDLFWSTERVAASLKEGIERASKTIKSGAAKQKMEEFVAFTQKAAK